MQSNDDSFDFPSPAGPYDEFDETSQVEMFQDEAVPLMVLNEVAQECVNTDSHERMSDAEEVPTTRLSFKWSNSWKSSKSRLNSLRPRNKSRNDLVYLQHTLEALEAKQENSEYKKLGYDEKYEENGLARKKNRIMIHFGQWKRYSVSSVSKAKQTFSRFCARFPNYLLQFHMLRQPTKQTKDIFFRTNSRIKQAFYYSFLGLSISLLVVTLLASYVVIDFLRDAEEMCRPPQSLYSRQFVGLQSSRTSEENYKVPPRPLVEYYIHGRGNGHYSRSVAIIKKLNAEGIDVRMFIGRAVMWKEVNAINDMVDVDKEESIEVNTENKENILDIVTDAEKARRVAKLILLGNDTNKKVKENKDKTEDTLHLILNSIPWEHEKILQLSIGLNDVEPEDQNNIETQGITTAISVTSLIPKLTILSSISLAVDRINGDCEVSRQAHRYPDLVVVDGDIPGMIRAKLGRIPSVSISHGQTFSIAEEPNWKSKTFDLAEAWKKQRWNSLPITVFSDWSIGTNFVPLEVKSDDSIIAKPPFRAEIKRMAKVRKMRIQRHHNAIDFYGTRPIAKKRNKLVLCYFRDKNGSSVVDILLSAGYDVVEFHSAKIKPGKEIGKQWMLTPDMREKAQEEINSRRELSASIESESNYSDNSNKEKLDGISPDPKVVDQPSPESEIGTQSKALLDMLNASSDAPRSIKVYDKNLFVAFMGIVDGIVGSGGSQLLSESIYGRIPMLALHRVEDAEQMLNIAMLQRKREEALIQMRNISSSASEKNAPPNTYGTSIETFLSIHSENVHTAEKEEKIKSDNVRVRLVNDESISKLEVTVAKREVKQFFEAIDQSVVSQSYYSDAFHMLHGVENIDKWGKCEEKNFESPLPNSWFDEMHDASDILFEIINEVF